MPSCSKASDHTALQGSAAKTPSSLFSRFTVTSPFVSSELPQASTASTASAGPETVEPMGTRVEVMGTQVKPIGTRVEHEDDTVSSWQALALEVKRCCLCPWDSTGLLGNPGLTKKGSRSCVRKRPTPWATLRNLVSASPQTNLMKTLPAQPWQA